MTTQFNIGNKVAVQITKPDLFTKDAFDAMDGRTGIVEQVKDGSHFTGHGDCKRPVYLIKFNKPVIICKAKGWDRPTEHFWIDERDLAG